MAKKILGKVAISPRGEYAESVTYYRLDLVSYNGSSYLSKIDNNTSLPSTAENWMLVVKKGDPFLYEDFTPEQLEALKVKGDPFTYADFTPEQLEALKPEGETPKYMEEILWANLIELMNNNQLIPGAKYLITDYQTVHTIPNTEDTNTGEVEPLLVTAISANELAPEAYSALFPDDVIYYSPTNDQTMVPGCTKGYI